jgi:hypothetical protein
MEQSDDERSLRRNVILLKNNSNAVIDLGNGIFFPKDMGR